MSNQKSTTQSNFEKWIVSKIDSDAISWSESTAKDLVNNNFTTTQLRKFFGAIKAMQIAGYDNDNTPSELALLRPKFAYAIARAKDNGGITKKFLDDLTNAVKFVKDDKSFKNFIHLFESVVAYHKFYSNEKTS